MNIFNEANTIQAMLLDAAVINGWMVMDKEFVSDQGNQGLPLQAKTLKKALLLLNKEKGLTETQADEIVRQIQGVYLGLVNPADLVEDNRYGDGEQSAQGNKHKIVANRIAENRWPAGACIRRGGFWPIQMLRRWTSICHRL